MFWSASPDGKPVHINRRVREYSGLSLEEFRDLGWEKFLHPEDFEETEVCRILPDWDRSLLATHTYNREGELTVLDCLVERPRFRRVRGRPAL